MRGNPRVLTGCDSRVCRVGLSVTHPLARLNRFAALRNRKPPGDKPRSRGRRAPRRFVIVDGVDELPTDAQRCESLCALVHLVTKSA